MAPVLVPKNKVKPVREWAPDNSLDLLEDAKRVEALRAATVEAEDTALSVGSGMTGDLL